MYYTKIKNTKLFKIGLILLVIFLMIFTVISIKYNRKITIVEKVTKDSVSFIVNVVSVPFKYINEKWDIFMQADNIYDEYVELKKERELSTLKEDKINELENENNELRELLELKSSILDYEEINATVIYRSANNWLNSIVIDKGSEDGLDNDMAVVVNGGLIGYTSNVSKHTSTVTLLTNSNMINKISVRIEVKKGTYAYGLLYSYDDDSNLYVVEGISEYLEIPVNATVTTTGLTEKFPGGVVVGNVKSVNTDNYDLKKVVMVTPSVVLDDITYVTVLKREAISE